MRNVNGIIKGMGAALLMAALASCGGGGSLVGTSSSSSGGNTGGGSNNTPPGIPNSIVFIPPSSSNTIISLQGAGGNTNADVTFQVNDASSTGVSGVPVTFTLIPATGDATLTTSTGTTDANGKVSTFVVSGNEHYSVTVLATVSTPSGTKTAQSNSLTISTGIPTEGNFHIAVANLTAPNADGVLGVTDVVTVQLSDRFNNPAPDGTAVAFTANSGQIPSQCLTAGGSCTVTWVSSGAENPVDIYHSLGQAEILAYTVGEESFDDVDGDGVFDNSDMFSVYSGSGPGDSFSEGTSDPAQDDIGEVYLDGDEHGSYQSGDFFHDFNGDFARNGPDGKFYGFGCKGTPTVPCGSRSTIGIGKQVCINMSTASASIAVDTGAGFGNGSYSSGTLTVPTSSTAPTTITFAVSDINGHALGAGTTVQLIQAGISSAIVVTSPTNLPFTYPDIGCGGNVQLFTITITPQPPATPPVAVAGTLQLTVTSSGTGGLTTYGPTITLQ